MAKSLDFVNFIKKIKSKHIFHFFFCVCFSIILFNFNKPYFLPRYAR